MPLSVLWKYIVGVCTQALTFVPLECGVCVSALAREKCVCLCEKVCISLYLDIPVLFFGSMAAHGAGVAAA